MFTYHPLPQRERYAAYILSCCATEKNTELCGVKEGRNCCYVKRAMVLFRVLYPLLYTFIFCSSWLFGTDVRGTGSVDRSRRVLSMSYG